MMIGLLYEAELALSFLSLTDGASGEGEGGGRTPIVLHLISHCCQGLYKAHMLYKVGHMYYKIQ